MSSCMLCKARQTAILTLHLDTWLRMHLKRVRRCLVVWRHLRVSCSVDALKMHGCKTHFTWKFPLKTRFQWMLRSCLATFYYKALRRSHMAAGACHCSKGQGSKGQGKALLQGFNNARALWRAHWTNLGLREREWRRCKSWHQTAVIAVVKRWRDRRLSCFKQCFLSCRLLPVQWQQQHNFFSV